MLVRLIGHFGVGPLEEAYDVSDPVVFVATTDRSSCWLSSNEKGFFYFMGPEEASFHFDARRGFQVRTASKNAGTENMAQIGYED